MKETIREGVLSLIKLLNEEIDSAKEIRKTAIKHENWQKAILCDESIFHKNSTIERLRKLL